MLTLLVRRRISATPARLFDAWTSAPELLAWWGPRGVECTHAEVDARVGGRYRIGNRLPDGQMIWLSGEFIEVEKPAKLVFTWNREGAQSEPERVTVRFEPRGTETEVIVLHERIADGRARDGHEDGWQGCLDGLASHVTRS